MYKYVSWTFLSIIHSFFLGHLLPGKATPIPTFPPPPK